MQNNLSPSRKGVVKNMANNAIIPAAEVAATNQVTAPVATTLTAPATEQKEPQTNSTSRRRRSTTPPMWRVMTQARPVFDVQLKKG